jgi:uncharacterized membrane protein YkvA (DUF1232 family)
MSTPDRELRPQLQDLKRKLRLHVAAWQASEEEAGSAWAPLLGRTAELFDLAVKLQLDERTPRDERERLLAALLYVAAPGDLAPERVLGANGYRDDLLVLALAVARALGKVAPEVPRELWTGPGEPRAVVGQIISRGEEIAGETLWPQVMSWVDS